MALKFPAIRAHWHPLANTIELVLPSAHPSSQPKRQIDRFSHFAQLTEACRRACPGHVLSLITAPSHGGSGPPSNTCFFGSTRVHNPNDIAIGSAVFAQFTSKCRRSCRDMSFPSKLPFLKQDLYPHLIRGSLGPPDSASQTGS